VLVIRRDRSKTVVVPAHNRPMKAGTLAAILKGAEMSPEQFRELL